MVSHTFMYTFTEDGGRLRQLLVMARCTCTRTQGLRHWAKVSAVNPNGIIPITGGRATYMYMNKLVVNSQIWQTNHCHGQACTVLVLNESLARCTRKPCIAFLPDLLSCGVRSCNSYLLSFQTHALSPDSLPSTPCDAFSIGAPCMPREIGSMCMRSAG